MWVLHGQTAVVAKLVESCVFGRSSCFPGGVNYVRIGKGVRYSDIPRCESLASGPRQNCCTVRSRCSQHVSSLVVEMTAFGAAVSAHFATYLL